MPKYIFPAIFTPEDAGYTVRFPDVHNCFTSGTDLADAVEMAEDVLCMMLYNLEEEQKAIPVATHMNDLVGKINNDEFVTLIACDTIEYRKFYDNRAVKKTLSIPSWLNDMAERAGINFSGTLQDALKRQLNIT